MNVVRTRKRPSSAVKMWRVFKNFRFKTFLINYNILVSSELDLSNSLSSQGVLDG